MEEDASRIPVLTYFSEALDSFEQALSCHLCRTAPPDQDGAAIRTFLHPSCGLFFCATCWTSQSTCPICCTTLKDHHDVPGLPGGDFFRSAFCATATTFKASTVAESRDHNVNKMKNNDTLGDPFCLLTSMRNFRRILREKQTKKTVAGMEHGTPMSLFERKRQYESIDNIKKHLQTHEENRHDAQAVNEKEKRCSSLAQESEIFRVKARNISGGRTLNLDDFCSRSNSSGRAGRRRRKKQRCKEHQLQSSVDKALLTDSASTTPPGTAQPEHLHLSPKHIKTSPRNSVFDFHSQSSMPSSLSSPKSRVPLPSNAHREKQHILTGVEVFPAINKAMSPPEGSAHCDQIVNSLKEKSDPCSLNIHVNKGTEQRCLSLFSVPTSPDFRSMLHPQSSADREDYMFKQRNIDKLSMEEVETSNNDTKVLLSSDGSSDNFNLRGSAISNGMPRTSDYQAILHSQVSANCGQSLQKQTHTNIGSGIVSSTTSFPYSRYGLKESSKETFCTNEVSNLSQASFPYSRYDTKESPKDTLSTNEVSNLNQAHISLACASTEEPPTESINLGSVAETGDFENILNSQSSTKREELSLIETHVGDNSSSLPSKMRLLCYGPEETTREVLRSNGFPTSNEYFNNSNSQSSAKPGRLKLKQTHDSEGTEVFSSKTSISCYDTEEFLRESINSTKVPETYDYEKILHSQSLVHEGQSILKQTHTNREAIVCPSQTCGAEASLRKSICSNGVPETCDFETVLNSQSSANREQSSLKQSRVKCASGVLPYEDHGISHGLDESIEWDGKPQTFDFQAILNSQRLKKQREPRTNRLYANQATDILHPPQSDVVGRNKHCAEYARMALTPYYRAEMKPLSQFINSSVLPSTMEIQTMLNSQDSKEGSVPNCNSTHVNIRKGNDGLGGRKEILPVNGSSTHESSLPFRPIITRTLLLESEMACLLRLHDAKRCLVLKTITCGDLSVTDTVKGTSRHILTTHLITHTENKALCAGGQGRKSENVQARSAICGRSFEYLKALSLGIPVISADWLTKAETSSDWRGEGSCSAWGDDYVCNSLVNLKMGQNDKYAWLELADWWGKGPKYGPCQSSLTFTENVRNGRLFPKLASFVVFIPTINNGREASGSSLHSTFHHSSNQQFKNQSDRKYPDLGDMSNSDSLPCGRNAFCNLTGNQVETLCHAWGAKVVKTGTHHDWLNLKAGLKRLVLVPDGADFLDFLNSPRTMVPFNYNTDNDIKPSCIESQNYALVVRSSWLVDSIAANTVAPIQNYQEGTVSWRDHTR